MYSTTSAVPAPWLMKRCLWGLCIVSVRSRTRMLRVPQWVIRRIAKEWPLRLAEMSWGWHREVGPCRRTSGWERVMNDSIRQDVQAPRQALLLSLRRRVELFQGSDEWEPGMVTRQFPVQAT